MSWGGLNPALTAWRNAYNRRLPGRGTASDGGYADPAHGSTSQHQPDGDGTVDANDMDVNVLGSGTPTGTPAERRVIEAMKLDFERDPRGRGQLWIHDREIANRDRSNWLEREYTGESPHDKHVHWESRQSHEDDGSEWPMPHTDALLRELRGEEVALTQPEISAVATEVVEQLREAYAKDSVGMGFQARRVPWAYPARGAGPENMAITVFMEMAERLERLETKVDALAEPLPE